MHLGMTEYRVPFSGHCDLDLGLGPSLNTSRLYSEEHLTVWFVTNDKANYEIQ